MPGQSKKDERLPVVINLEAYLHVAWWLPFYAWGVSWMCALTGQDYDSEKVAAWINRAMKIKFREVAK